MKTQAVVQMVRVLGQVTRQTLHRLLSLGSVFVRQGGTHVLTDAVPTVGQQALSALLQPCLGFRSAFAEERFGGVGDVAAGMVNVQDPGGSRELHFRMVPDPLRAVAEDGDRSIRLDSQALHPLLPLWRERVDRFDRRERISYAGFGQWPCIPCFGGCCGTERTLRSEEHTSEL